MNKAFGLSRSHARFALPIALAAVIAVMGCAEDSSGTECTAGGTQAGITPCGLNGTGALEQSCDGGAWVDSGICLDPAECTNEETRVLVGGAACGAMGSQIGQQLETCVDGMWSDEGTCSCGDVVYGGDLVIDSAADLVLLSGVTQVTGTLRLDGFTGSDLSSMPPDLKCIGRLSVESNSALTSLSGLEALESIGGDVWIFSNSSLQSLSGLDGVTTIGGDLFLAANPLLMDFSGLEGLTSISGDLRARANASLVDFSGLNALTSIGGDAYLTENANLENLSGLDAVVSIGGTLQVDENDSLTDLSGLDALASIGGRLQVWDNPSLTSLSGLEALVSIGATDPAYLWVTRNDQLTDLTGLSALATVNGFLRIEDNPELATLGLAALRAVDDATFVVINNPMLDTCDAQGLYDQLDDTSGFINVDVSTGNIPAPPGGC